MIAKVLVIADLKSRKKVLLEELKLHGLKIEHVDVLYIDSEQKMGIEQSRNIKGFFQTKPYQAAGKAVVVEDISGITPEAQNALLKLLEEPPESAIILLGTAYTHHLLPTFLSRVQVVHEVIDSGLRQNDNNSRMTIVADTVVEKILTGNTEERFKIVEKATDKKQLLQKLLIYTEKRIARDPSFHKVAKDILRAEEWVNANVNSRGVLEYLMLVIPKK